MVRFSSGKTSVQLSIIDLEKTAGTIPETPRNAKQSNNIQQCNLEFGNGSQHGILPELYITDPEDGMCTHFLGKNKNIPFLMAQAGCNIVSATASEIRNTRPAEIQLENNDEELRIGTVTYTSLGQRRIYSPPSKPQGLCLTVILDPKAFISLEPKAKKTVKDIKIDGYRKLGLYSQFQSRLIFFSSNRTDTADFGIELVFLNGQFFDRELVRSGYATRNGAITKQVVRFTGHRIRGPIEKPWILVPSGQNPDGTPALYRGRGSDTPGRKWHAPCRRWHAISKALLSSADGAGKNRDGERSALGECLESLALLPMQPQVVGPRNPGSGNFGVIDVIISWAKGMKVNQPETDLSSQRITLVEGYGNVKPVDLLVDNNAEDTVSRIPSPDTAPRTPTNISAGTKLFDDAAENTATSSGNTAAYPSPSSCARTPPTSMAPTTNIGRSNIGRSRLVASSSRKRTRSASVPDSESQSKRRKQTLEQEMASIQKKAEEDNRTSKGGPQSTPSNVRRKNRPIDIEDSSTIGHLSPESISLAETEDKNHTPGERRLSKDSLRPTETEDETDTPGPARKGKLKLPPSTMKLRPSKNAESSKGKGKEATVENLENPRQRSVTKAVSTGQPRDAGFKVPELSKNCVITYAPPGLVRDVGASRKTYFVEEGAVIVAVRFLVG